MPRLQPLNPKANCPKCGSRAIGVEYCDGAMPGRPCHGKVPRGQHLHRECGSCGFMWFEACVDDVPPVEPVPSSKKNRNGSQALPPRMKSDQWKRDQVKGDGQGGAAAGGKR